ncbi:septal ring lytic transglycosylase RlpA family protein [Lutimonas sp.]|uniref:septal ring lytic transglycosylase RlpA family protein n=1 Tax=Lutimonas sp. TaxID=1872403 RepID=UPI003D9B9EB2
MRKNKRVKFLSAMVYQRKIFLCFFFLLGSLLYTGSVYGQQQETGVASFYNDQLQGRRTASGEVYDTIRMTAAHRSIPFSTKVKVTHLDTKKSVIVIVNDRGPFVEGRVIDLSKAAAKELDFLEKGLAKVSIEIIE